MSFIAYAGNLEQTARLISFNKNINLNDAHDKNRIFVTGHSIMSQKLSSTDKSINKACENLSLQPVFRQKIKRCNILEKGSRNECHKKMRESLAITLELTQKYVDLDDYKKVACCELDQMV